LPHAEFSAGHGLMAVILIVEDEMFIRQAAEWAIEDLGHHPLMASDLAEALSYVSTGQPIDALFVDIRLALLHLGGYDVANQVIALRPDLPVLYTSGTPLNAEMQDQFVGGGRFLQKPYSAKQLGVSMTELLRQQPTRSPGDALTAP
jgi:CheY-like chemotaxis protein